MPLTGHMSTIEFNAAKHLQEKLSKHSVNFGIDLISNGNSVCTHHKEKMGSVV